MGQLIKPGKEVKSQHSLTLYLEIKIFFKWASNLHLLICGSVLPLPKKYYYYFYLIYLFIYNWTVVFSAVVLSNGANKLLSS